MTRGRSSSCSSTYCYLPLYVTCGRHLLAAKLRRSSIGTLRLALLKIGAVVTTSVRRLKFAMAAGCPCQHDFRDAHARLAAAAR